MRCQVSYCIITQPAASSGVEDSCKYIYFYSYSNSPFLLFVRPCAILKHSGADFIVKEPKDAPPNSGFAVPIMTFPAGYSISQAPIICAELGKQLGLLGSGEAEEVLGRQLLADAADFLIEILGNKPADRLRKWFQHFEGKLGGKDFLLGSLSACDFFLFHCLHLIKEKKRVGKYDVPLSAALEAFYARVGSVPTITEMLSEKPIMPDHYL